MQIRAFRCCFCFAAISFFACAGLARQTNAAGDEQQSLQGQIARLQHEIKDANDRHAADLKKLQAEVELLKQTAAQPKESVTTPGQNQGGPGPSSWIGQSFNPDISAIGDLVFNAGQNPKGETPDSLTAPANSKAQLREIELGFSNPVDPYGRADMVVSVARQEDGSYAADIEEGYFTYTALPYDLQARFGKFYSVFGKVNPMHTHALPWVDRPLVITKFFGEEPLSDVGGELSWLVPNPWDQYIQLTQDIQGNGNEADFAGSHSNGLMYVTHLKSFFELGNTSTAELGGSFATGTNGSGNSGGPQTNVEGLDFTYKWRPEREGLYKSVTWMNELLFNQKDQPSGKAVDAYGWYTALEYQFSRRWSVFGRYDYTQFPDDSSLHENSCMAGLTFRQSEFMFWRLQVEHTTGENFAGGVDRNQILLQADFLIGLHPAHTY